MSALLPLLLGVVALGACSSHPYRVEEREVPVHVWVTAPEQAAAGGTLQALVYVGPTKVVEGPLSFERGRPTIELPTAHVRAGPVAVSAVLDGGAIAASDRPEIERESWVEITVRGRSATLRISDEQPPLAPR